MRYISGTRIQRRDGHLWVKSEEYGPIKEGRLIAMLKEGRDITPWDKVFFVDGNRENTRPENIVVVHFNQVRFKYLRHSRIIYVPRRANEGGVREYANVR